MNGDVVKAVTALGIVFEEAAGDELLACCPMHKARTGRDDANPSWSINTDTGKHLCFSCGYSGGLLRLVADVKGFVEKWGEAESPDYDAAKRWLLLSAALEPEDLLRKIEESKRRAVTIAPIPMTESRLALYTAPPPEAIRRRRLSPEVCERYQILWDSNRDLWITPLRDLQHHLIGWQEKGEYERYFRNRPRSMRKSTTLFGWRALQGTDSVVVVESPLDAARVTAATGEQAVATCGAVVSKEQVHLLRSFDRVVWALDNPRVDPAGRKAYQRLWDDLRHYAIPSYFWAYGDTGAKDPGDMYDDEIKEALAGAKSILYGKESLYA